MLPFTDFCGRKVVKACRFTLRIFPYDSLRQKNSESTPLKTPTWAIKKQTKTGERNEAQEPKANTYQNISANFVFKFFCGRLLSHPPFRRGFCREAADGVKKLKIQVTIWCTGNIQKKLTKPPTSLQSSIFWELKRKLKKLKELKRLTENIDNHQQYWYDKFCKMLEEVEEVETFRPPRASEIQKLLNRKLRHGQRP